MAANQGVADKPILITPRTLVGIIGAVIVATIASYMWIFATFVTATTFEAHASDFSEHIEAQTIWQLETRLEDISDQRMKLQMVGITPQNRDFDRDLQKREDKLTKQISCLQQNGKHCLRKSEPS